MTMHREGHAPGYCEDCWMPILPDHLAAPEPMTTRIITEEQLAEALEAALLDHEHEARAPLTIRADHLASVTYPSCASRLARAVFAIRADESDEADPVAVAEAPYATGGANVPPVKPHTRVVEMADGELSVVVGKCHHSIRPCIHDDAADAAIGRAVRRWRQAIHAAAALDGGEDDE